MRKMRKTLSFVLILALVLGSFSMAFGTGALGTVGVELSDIEGLAGEEQIVVNANLGIIEGFPDGTFKPEELLNRAQFAAIITRALGIPESALEGFTTTTFNDTDGYSWAIKYLAFCQARGIMIGDGYGNAMPGRTVSVNEAVTMILRAIGYIDSSSRLVGAWPANYVTLAQAVGLYNNIAADAQMTRENAAIAMYNGLTVQLVAVGLDAHTADRWHQVPVDNEDPGIPMTLLTTGLEGTSQRVVLGASRNYGPLTAEYDNTLINIADRLGAFGIGYFNKDDILVAFVSESEFVTGYFDKEFFEADRRYALARQALSYDNAYYDRDWYNVITGFYNGEEQSDMNPVNPKYTPGAVVADTFRVMLSEAAFNLGGFDGLGDYDDLVIDPLDYTPEVTLSVRMSGSTIREVYAVLGYKADHAAVIDASQISAIAASQSIFHYDLPVNDDGDIDRRQVALVGVKNISDISENDVVYVYKDSDEIIRKVAVGKETLEGTPDRSSNDFFRLDGTDYDYAYNYLRYKHLAIDPYELLRGEDSIMRLDAYGQAFSVDSVQVGNYGVIEWYNLAGRQAATVSMYDAAGDTWNMDLARRADFRVLTHGSIGAKRDPRTLIDDSDTPRAYEVVEDATSRRTMASGNVIQDVDVTGGALVAYRTNSAGTAIEHVTMAVTHHSLTMTNRLVLRHPGPGATNTVSLKDLNVPVFYYDSAVTTGAILGVATAADIDLDVSREPAYGAYLLNDRGDTVLAMMVPDTWVGREDNVIYGVLNRVTHATKDGNNVLVLSVLVDGKVNRDLYTTFSNPAKVPLIDEAYAFKLNAAGDVREVETVLAYGGLLDLSRQSGMVYTEAALVITAGGVGVLTDYLDALSIRVEKTDGDYEEWFTILPNPFVYKNDGSSGSDRFKLSNRNELEQTIQRILSRHASVVGKDLYVWIYDTEESGMAEMILWMLVDQGTTP